MASGERPAATPPQRSRLAEALDLSVVVLLVAAYAVAASGGFRWEPFGVRLSMTSPSRTVLLAGLLVLVRRWRAPGVPLHRWLARPLARLRQPSIPDTESSILNSQFSILNSSKPALLRRHGDRR
jgi:hypothetical protein